MDIKFDLFLFLCVLMSTYLYFLKNSSFINNMSYISISWLYHCYVLSVEESFLI